MELLRTYEVHFFFLILKVLFILASALAGRIGWLSFQGLGWGVLCFRPGLRGEDSGPLPCSSVCGLHCTGPTYTRQSQWETVISCAGGQVLPGLLGLRIVGDASGSFLPQGVA